MMTSVSAIIFILLSTTPNRLLYRDANARDTMSRHFVDAGERYNIEPSLLVTWSFYESSFRVDAEGALGEVGLFQVHGKHLKACEGEHDLSTARGQVMCGAMLIDMDRRFCGSLERGLWRYASGRCMGTPRARRITAFRLRRLERLRGRVQKEKENGKGD
jgi:hypothetical protein